MNGQPISRRRLWMRRIGMVGLAIVVVNEIRGVLVVAAVGWPILARIWGID
jgi:hypothetical protein